MLSVIIPVYNEEGAVGQTIKNLQAAFERFALAYELVVVDDGSTDGTANILRTLPHIHAIRHRRNTGYGSALKTGLRHAKGKWIAIIDADGTYKADDLVRLYNLAQVRHLDMLIGDRSKDMSSVPWYRRPGKVFVTWLAMFLLWQRVPDINSGLRVFRRDMAEKFMHLYPQGFSFTVTITLAALTSNYLVEWEAISYAKRIGESEIRFWNGLTHTFPNFVALVIRIITYFKPLRFFLVPAAVLFSIGVVNLGRTIAFQDNVTDASLLLLLASLQICLMGLITDVIVKSRR